MKLCIVTCQWRRPNLTKIISEYYAKQFPDITLIAVRSPADQQTDVDGWNYEYFPNSPLSQKFNAGFNLAKRYNPDAVILIGSDDLISPELVKFYQENYSADADYILGLKDIYFYEIQSQQTLYFKGLIGMYENWSLGCGRIFSRKVLEQCNWRPYYDLQIDRGLDCNSMIELHNRGIKEKVLPMSEAGLMVDIKVKATINKFEDWKHNSTEGGGGIVWENFKDVMLEIDKMRIDTTKFPEGMWDYILTGKDEELGAKGSKIYVNKGVAIGLYGNGLIEFPT
jgi:hypothetical protein